MLQIVIYKKLNFREEYTPLFDCSKISPPFDPHLIASNALQIKSLREGATYLGQRVVGALL